MSEYNEWLQSLQSLLDRVITPIVRDKDMRAKYFEPEKMKVWAKAFTHETVSPTDNYENLEYLGDAQLKSIFPTYLIQKFPLLNKGDYTELNVAYMSKIMQAQLSKQMGFGNYIRVKGIDRAILNLEADVFESFFGALYTVSHMIDPLSGFIKCYDMINSIFENIKIDENKAKGSAKTQVIQMFVRFDLPKPKEISSGSIVTVEATNKFTNFLNQNGISKQLLGQSSASKEKDCEHEAYTQVVNILEEIGLIKVTKEKIVRDGEQIDFAVELTKEHMAFLNRIKTSKPKRDENGKIMKDANGKILKIEKFVVITNPLIGYAEAATKKEASYKAYEQALQTLKKHKIDLKRIRTYKRLIDLLDPIVLPYTEKAYARIKREGYKEMYFFIPRKLVTPKGAVIELIGIKSGEEGKETEVALAYIHATDRENSYRNAKASLLQNYGNGY